MLSHHASRPIAVAVLLALLASLAAPLPALAEEQAPPVDPPAEAPPPSESAPSDSAEPGTETSPAPIPEDDAAPPPTEALPEGEAPAEDPAATPEEPSGEMGLPEMIEAAPEGTTVAVVAEDGALLPLVSEQAAEIAVRGDPIWCPASVKAPTPNLNGCTDSYTTFAALLGALALPSVTPADGIIWIDAAYTGAGEGGLVNINGSLLALAAFAPFKLTLRGGWDGVEGSKLIVGTSTFSATRLQIQNWGNDVTLSDILIANAPVGDALVVTTSGNITLTRVEASNNTGRGARLDNTSATTPRVVSISDSQFNDNNATGGFSVLSDGAITLTNITAGYYDEVTDMSYGNVGYGAILDNTTGTAGVSLKGINTFSINSGTGLQIASNGAITANDLTASGNTSGGRGAYLDNDSSPTAAGVTLTGTNIFADNASIGLDVSSAGPITLNNIHAHASATGYGANLANAGAATAQPVTLTGASSFKYNYNTGLRIRSNGAVTLNSITASGSAAGAGASVSNDYSGFSSPVTLTGSSVFNDNFYDGLTVASYGAIKAANVSASSNALVSHVGYGISLDNHFAASPQAVTLTGTTTVSGNYTAGLRISSAGGISVQNLTARDTTHGSGASLTNTGAPAQKVTLSGTNTFIGNYAYGLEIASAGAVTLSNLRATGNGPGANNPGVYIDNSGATAAQKVTLTGANAFHDNYGAGLAVNATGAIAASNLTVSGNAAGGASLDNTGAPTAQPVSLTGKNVFSNNVGDGLYVFSRGAVSLASLTASGNSTGYGVYVNNRDGPDDSPQKVTLTGIHQFTDNAQDGLTVYSYGAISLSSMTASGNGTVTGNGVSLSNHTSAGPQPVTLSGSFTFDENGGYGLRVSSKGVIKAASLTARGNVNAVFLSNNFPDAVGGITLTGTNVFERSAYAGAGFESLGAISLSSVIASGNGTAGAGSGATISNAGAATPQKISLTGANIFNDNADFGVQIISLGAISAGNLSASGNGSSGWGFGAQLDNEEPGAAGGITLSGTSAFNGNDDEGLSVTSLGLIAVNTTRLEASRNGGGDSWNGVTLSNANATGGLPGITVKGASVFNDNTSTGLSIYTKGAITLSSITASGNGGVGAWVHNNVEPGSTSAVALSGTSTFNENGYSGLDIYSNGAISISNLTASDNGQSTSWGYGAYLINTSAPSSSVQPVKLTGYATFNGNLDQGLAVYSLGAISAANLTASGNESDGAALSNDGAGAVGSVTVSGTNAFNGNERMGLDIGSLGAVTLSNLTASGNGWGGSGDGVSIDNAGAATPQAFKLTGYGVFHDNASSGLDVYSAGAISAANLTARGNGGSGAYLDNDLSANGVTLTGTNIFTGNSESGLYITSLGAVSLSRIIADGNASSGLYAWLAGGVGSLTISCGSFTFNGGYGLYVNTSVDPVLIGVVGSGNLGEDLYWAGVGAITSDVRACPGW